MLEQKRLKQLLHYDPDTGIVTRRIKVYERPVGSVVGWKHGKHVSTSVDGHTYRLHRLIWFLVTGKWPKEIDHINGNGFDNRWVNLRNVSHAENLRNSALRIDNTSGIVGVSYVKNRDLWRSYIKNQHGVQMLYWGRDFFEACCRRKSTEVKYGFHKNHGRCRQSEPVQ